MRKGVLLAAILISAGIGGFALEFRGSWEGTLALGGPPVPVNTITLDIGFADWQLTAVSVLEGTSLVRQGLALAGTIGALGIAAGATFRIPQGDALSWVGPVALSLDGVEFLGGYISLALDFGNITLRLTLVGGAPSIPEP